MWVKPRLEEMGLGTTVPVTSGSKGMQLYAALPGKHSADDIRDLVQDLAQEMTKKHPDLVVWKMTKSLRPGKIFVDWSQNTAAKTTICPYSLRGKAAPYVAAPRTWEEVEEGAVRRPAGPAAHDRGTGPPRRCRRSRRGTCSKTQEMTRTCTPPT